MKKPLKFPMLEGLCGFRILFNRAEIDKKE
jgi:hypothetical protein